MSEIGADALFPGPEITLELAARWVSRIFTQAGVPEAALDARLLVAAAAKLDHAGFIREGDRALGSASSILKESISRRIAREPVSRILRRREFWGLEFEISADVLDPRPETELIVSTALERLMKQGNDRIRILDLGVGSGAILCALLTELKQARGMGIDISHGACAIARENARRLGLSDRAHIQHGDWKDFSGAVFDLIVGNPPYVSSADLGRLEPEVSQFDPKVALDGGADGLEAYRTLGQAIPKLLAPNSLALFEIGIGQASAVTAILSAKGLTVTQIVSDLAGVARVAVCENETKEADIEKIAGALGGWREKD